MNKKLTVTEILDIIEKEGISVSSFAYCELTDSMSEDFKFSEELQRKIDDFESKRGAFQNHPDYEKYGWNTTDAPQEYKDVSQAFIDSRYPNQEIENEYLDSIGIGSYEEVEKYGGEDQGSTWYSVKYFKNHDVYIRTDGYYQSYNGTEFDDGYGEEVFPVEKTITVYEPK